MFVHENFIFKNLEKYLICICTLINFDYHAAFKANILVSIETNVWMIWCETSIFMKKKN